jgi:hypothetical protein
MIPPPTASPPARPPSLFVYLDLPRPHLFPPFLIHSSSAPSLPSTLHGRRKGASPSLPPSRPRSLPAYLTLSLPVSSFHASVVLSQLSPAHAHAACLPISLILACPRLASLIPRAAFRRRQVAKELMIAYVSEAPAAGGPPESHGEHSRRNARTGGRGNYFGRGWDGWARVRARPPARSLARSSWTQVWASP